MLNDKTLIRDHGSVMSIDIDLDERTEILAEITRRITDLNEESLVRLSEFISFLKWQEEQWRSPTLGELEGSQPQVIWRFDMVEQFAHARQASTQAPAGMEIKVGPASSGGELRPAIWEHPPVAGAAVIEYQFTVPMAVERLRFRASVGVRDGSLITDNNPVAFRLYVNGHKLWSTLKASCRWDPVEIVLPSLAGREVTVQLVTDGLGDARWNWAVWGDPQVVGYASAT